MVKPKDKLDKFQNVDGDIFGPMVVHGRKVSADGCVRFVWMINAVEMAFESLLDLVFGLPNILFVASRAADAINQVVAVTGHVVSGGINQTRIVAGNSARFV